MPPKRGPLYKDDEALFWAYQPFDRHTFMISVAFDEDSLADDGGVIVEAAAHVPNTEPDPEWRVTAKFVDRDGHRETLVSLRGTGRSLGRTASCLPSEGRP